MNEKGIVSIITPVYNVEKYLNRCVNSILDQSYSNFELFLIDDGSTDSSGAICDEFAKMDSRVTVIHKKNEGQGIARNSALDIARGEYIAFIDSDDYVRKEYLNVLVSEIEKNNADMAVCGVINDHGFAKKECPKRDNTVWTKEELFVSYLTEPYIRGVLWNKLYKSFLFSEERFSCLRAREDAELLYKIYGKCEKIIYVKEPLYVQLIRPGSTEQSPFNKEKLFTITIFEQMGEYIIQKIPSLSPYARLLKAKAIVNTLYAIASDKKREQWIELYDKLEKDLQIEIDRNSEYKDNIFYRQALFVLNNRKKILKRGTIQRIRSSLIAKFKRIFYLIK